MNKIYAGIGTRKLPEEYQGVLTNVGVNLARIGYTLRSGAAIGSDSCFEFGCDKQKGKKEIFTAKSNIPQWAFDLVPIYHPAPQHLNEYAMRLMARNGMILLGEDGNTPVDFVVCYCENERKGGTAYGISIAREKGIPIYNFASKYYDAWEEIKKVVR